MASNKRSRALRRFALVPAAVLVGTIVVGVALALVIVQISGTVASNEFATTTTSSTTTTTTLPPGDGLVAAISTTGAGQGPCDDAITAGNLALGSITFDLNSSAAQSYSPSSHLCVRNDGTGQINTLTVGVITTGTAELGCSDDEGTVDPEGATCGSAGELGQVLQVVLIPAQLQDAGCRSGTTILTPGGSSVPLLTGSGQLSPGFFCSYEVQLQLDPSATYDQKLAASTDDVSFTLDVAGSG